MNVVGIIAESFSLLGIAIIFGILFIFTHYDFLTV